jgi:hypothetical protein
VSAGREALARHDRHDRLAHIALVDQLDGKAVDWMEKVTDDDYEAANAGSKAAG